MQTKNVGGWLDTALSVATTVASIGAKLLPLVLLASDDKESDSDSEMNVNKLKFKYGSDKLVVTNTADSEMGVYVCSTNPNLNSSTYFTIPQGTQPYDFTKEYNFYSKGNLTISTVDSPQSAELQGVPATKVITASIPNLPVGSTMQIAPGFNFYSIYDSKKNATVLGISGNGNPKEMTGNVSIIDSNNNITQFTGDYINEPSSGVRMVGDVKSLIEWALPSVLEGLASFAGINIQVKLDEPSFRLACKLPA